MCVRPISIEALSILVSSLIAHLNSNMCLNIDPMPDLARGTELHAMPSSLVMVGGSHAAKMAGLMQSRLPSFTHGGWRAGFIAVEAMA
jgi:hypothetical protein